MLEITILSLKLIFFAAKKTSLSGTSISLPKIADLPISFQAAEWLALPTSDHGVAGSNPAGGEFLPEPKRRFIAQSLSCSPFHRLEMTEILLKGRKTLTHPSIHPFQANITCMAALANDGFTPVLSRPLKLERICKTLYPK